MDKDLLRIVIIAIGAVVILGMILWSMFRGGKRQKNMFDADKDPLENIDPSLVVSTEDDDFDVVPLGTVRADDHSATVQVKTRLNDAYMQEVQQNGDVDLGDVLAGAMDKSEDLELSISKELPSLIQLSVAAKSAQGISGTQLVEACEQLGLVFGSVQVFERLDAHNRVDYAVASMVEPGIFPGSDWEDYSCPGVTFFMQPREVNDAQAVFAEMINTIGQLAALLQADVLDQNREILTEAALQEIELSLL
jgi:cell division protein ZipA